MNEWMNHPAMKNLDSAKLELIKTAYKSGSGLIRSLLLFPFIGRSTPHSGPGRPGSRSVLPPGR